MGLGRPPTNEVMPRAVRTGRYTIVLLRVAEPCHFSAAPEPSIFFTAPAPTYIASHQFLIINAYGTVPCLFTTLLHAWVTWGPFRPEVGSVLILST